MNRGSLLYQSIFVLTGSLAFCAHAHADPIGHFTNFDENIVIETFTFETSGGAVLFTTNGVGYTDWLSPNIAADLAGDPTVPAQVQSTLSLVPLVSEYQFLAEQGPGYIVLGGAGPAMLDPAFDNIPVDVAVALAAAGGPGYAVVGSPNIFTIGQPTYETGALEPDGSFIDGTVNFDLIGESIVERPVATPEPSMLAVAGAGFAVLILKRVAKSRWRRAVGRYWFLRQSVFAVAVVFAAKAHADPIVHTTQFDEDIAIITDTFETSAGAVLFTTNGVGYSDWLSPNIAADLAGDSTVPTQIRSTASLVALASEYQFLAEQGPQYIVLGGVGPAILDPLADYTTGFDVGYVLAAATGPAYSIVGSPIFTTLDQRTYNDGAIEPVGSLIQGTVTFSVYDESIVEKPVTATPEPSMLALLGSCFLTLICFARRKAAGGIA